MQNLRYSPVNWLIVNWGFNGTRFDDCGLPEPPPCPAPVPEREPPCTPLLVKEAIDTYDWERWLPEVIVGIEEPDEEIAASYVRETAIDFARRSRVLQRQALIPLQPDVCTYPVEQYADERIVGVIGLALDDYAPCACTNHCSAFMPNDVDFTFDAARSQIHLESHQPRGRCHNSRVLRMLVWSAPAEDACAQDVFLYDHYRKAIAEEARRRYARAVHFRDRNLMMFLPKDVDFEVAVARAKTSAMATHSWAVSKPGSGMWSLNPPSRGTWR